MTTEASLKGVIVGLGSMGENHLRVLNSLHAAGVCVAAVVDPDRERREQCLDGLTEIRSYDSLDQALVSEELDFACIATPTEYLPACATEALDAGLHVLVEKPMAPDLSQAEDLVSLARSRPQVFMVGLVERCNPAVRALKERLEHGQAGSILQMHARRLSPFPNRSATASVALDLVTHDIDVMRYLSGSEVERLYAETAAAVGGTTEDLVCATVRLASGTTGLLESNWISPAKVRELTVTGDRGMFVVDYLTQDLTFFEHPTKPTVWQPLAGLRGGGEGNMVRYAIERWEPLRVEWDGFLAAIRTGQPPLASAEDGYAALAVAEAIRTAGAEHELAHPSPVPTEVSVA